MKVYVAYYYFSGLQTNGGRLRSCECYQLMGIFSTYEKAFESFREKYEYYEECGNKNVMKIMLMIMELLKN